MIPQELLRTATVPGGGELRLYRHDRDFAFRVDGTELMNSRVHGSEQMLAELTIERLGARADLRVLVGGLGMGFTLARLLELTDERAEIHVVELVPDVIVWNQELLGELTGHPLTDARVRVAEGDVVPAIRGARAEYDAILLDVDNGPEGLTHDGNDRLYSQRGLEHARVALRPCGVLSVWSAADHPWFVERMRRAGFEVEQRRVRARRVKGARRTIWLGTRA